jgi:hypothetical protein
MAILRIIPPRGHKPVAERIIFVAPFPDDGSVKVGIVEKTWDVPTIHHHVSLPAANESPP